MQRLGVPKHDKKFQRLANSLLRFLVDMTAAAKTNTDCNRGWKLAGEFFSHVTDDSLSTVSFPLLPTVHYTNGYKRNCTFVCWPASLSLLPTCEEEIGKKAG